VDLLELDENKEKEPEQTVENQGEGEERMESNM
jgi:hypothetical protein